MTSNRTVLLPFEGTGVSSGFFRMLREGVAARDELLSAASCGDLNEGDFKPEKLVSPRDLLARLSS